MNEEQLTEIQGELQAAIHLETGGLKEELETIVGFLDMATEKHNALTAMTLQIVDTSEINFARMTRFMLAISEHAGFDVKSWMRKEKRQGR